VVAAARDTLEARRIGLPTGLLPEEVRALRRDEKITLAAWHTEIAGDDNGREWLPASIRLLGPDAQLALATDDDLLRDWTAREIRDCKADPWYFIQGYGSVLPDQPGPPIPFRLWPAQERVLDLILTERLLAILKARQLGLSWLALHFATHLIGLNPAGHNAVVLGLSQDGGYAKRLLERVRDINDRLPPFLRGIEDRETAGSKTELKLVERGRMVSLPGTPAAPRSWQADLAIGDEWAFVRNGQAGPTLTALLPAARKIILISSGNGGPDEEGWGQSFAQTYTKAREGQSDFVAVFLPTSTHPDRDEAWREAERENYDTDEDFLAEHPETDDEGLIGAGRDRYFKLGDIAAAVKLGAELDQLLGTDEMPPPYGGALAVGQDWGENGVALPIWPLERGGVYVPPGETYGHGIEPGEQTLAFLDALAELQEVDPRSGRLMPPIDELRYDAAGVQSQRTAIATARARRAHQFAHSEVRSRKVPFGKYKTETAKYLRRLAKRAGQGRTTGVLAISPSNVQLIRQLRALESGPGGVWKKATDQDGPDALVAGVQRIARAHRELIDDNPQE
jgi:hypothetical protein